MAADDHGRIDGLVNNAGIAMRARLGEITLEELERVTAVNVTGALLGIQATAPLMRRGGSIVNVSSFAGLVGSHAVGYTISKWGIRGLSRTASLELGPKGIRVEHDLPRLHRDADDRERPPAFRLANIEGTPLGRGRTARGRRTARRVPDLGRVVVHQRRRDRGRRRPDAPTAGASTCRTP